MARQRFIWPSLWTDATIGKLSPPARLLFIGCFSNADDEGRLEGDPTYLRATVFPHDAYSPTKVKVIRDELVSKCRNLTLYEVAGREYLTFTKWGQFQKPKYPSPSKLPKPPNKRGRKPSPLSQKLSGNVPEGVPEDSPMGRDGLGRVGNVRTTTNVRAAAELNPVLQTEAKDARPTTSESAAAELIAPRPSEIRQIVDNLKSKDDGTLARIEPLAAMLDAATVHAIAKKVHERRRVRNDAGLLVELLRGEVKARAAAQQHEHAALSTLANAEAKREIDELHKQELAAIKAEPAAWMAEIGKRMHRELFDAWLEKWTADDADLRANLIHLYEHRKPKLVPSPREAAA